MRPRPRIAVLLAAALVLGGLALGACADDPRPSLVGTWQEARWADTADVFQRRIAFDAAGEVVFQIHRPSASDTTYLASYTLEHDTLLTIADARGSEQFIARLLGDTLVLRTPEMTTTLVRVADLRSR